MNWWRLALAVLVGAGLSTAGQAQEISHSGEFRQGGLVVGLAPPGTQITQDGQSIRVARDGRFLLGFRRDAGPGTEIHYRFSDGREQRRRFAVIQRDYRVQRIDGLPRRKVTPDPADLKRIKAESRLMSAARGQTARELFAASGFEWPARGRISGVYGSQRILNGKPRRPHFGVDVAAPVGSPVRAPADGVVQLTHPGMFFNGKTVVLDHGLGLNSVFVHLNAILVKDGARVTKGTLLARVGKTGRATGPHLHWGVRLGSINLDPMLLVPPMPEPAP